MSPWVKINWEMIIIVITKQLKDLMEKAVLFTNEE